MIRIFKLVLLLVCSQVVFGQAPSNYTNINGRYRWIAGMFDSTFHIPKGTTNSLRVGGSTNAGALFYNTTDSTVYTYTGTQWIKLRGVVIDTTSLSNRINLKLNISDTAAMLAPYLRKVDTASLSNRINLKVNISDTASMLNPYLRKIDTASLSNRINLKLNISDTASMLSPYLRKIDTASLSNRINLKVNISDTATMLSPYARKNFLNAGTGISYSSTTGTIANTAPDQTVALNAGTGISISGTYPNFTITNSSPSSGGTVTSVGSNNGTGLTGGPITTSGTLAIDTLLVSTRAWRQKGIDSVQANLTAGLALKLNISDTSSMLSPYLRKVDTASLSNRINQKLNISDTATMLGNYVNNVGYGLLKSGQVVTADSATLANYFLRRKDSLTSTNLLGYVTRKVLADTAAAIRSADAGGTVTSVATNNGTGITGGTITTAGTLAIDTVVISTRAWRQKGIDSVQANLTAGLAGKVNISDTASMLTPYLRKIDTTAMLSPYLRANVAAATYAPQSRTITINGTSQDLSANRTFNVGTVTSVGITAGTGISVANSPVTGSGNITVTNTAPDQTVSLSAGTGISIAGTYPSFTITNSSPSSGGTVTSVGSGTGLTGGPITTSGTLAVDTLLISTRLWRQKGVDSVAALANTKVSSVSGTSPISSSGGTSPTISISQASGSTDGFLSSTDWTTFNNKQNALTNPVTGTGTTNYIPKFTSSSAIGNSNLQTDASGNLGLGVTPSAWTSTWRAIQLSGGSVYTNAGGTTGLIGVNQNSYYDGSNNRYLNSAAATDYYQFGGEHRWFNAPSGTAGNAISFTQAMTLDASGTLFIGKTNSATTNTTGISLGSGGIFAHSSSGNGYIDLGATRASVAANIGGVVQFRAVYRNSDSDNTTIAFIKGMREDATNNLWRSYLSFETTNTDGFTISEKMRITSGGNVGIGTTSPASLFHIYSTSPTARLQGNTTTNLATISTLSFSNTNDITGGYQVASISAIRKDYDNGADLLFSTALAASTPTERMRITSGGNVGIGTTSPAVKLHIVGGGEPLRIESTNGTGGNYVQYKNASGDLGYIGYGSTANNVLNIANQQNSDITILTNSTERMRITSGGGVVIGGTVASNVGLTIYGSNAATIYQTPNTGTGAGNGFYVGHTGDISYLWNYNNYPTVFATNNTERMRITSGGELLVGDTTASAKLTVTGVTNGQSIRTEHSSAYSFLYSTIGGASPIAFDNNSGNLIIYTASSERMRITSGGDLGIGTTTIGSRLQVNGNAAIGYSASTAAPTNGLSISGNTTIGTTTAAGKFTIDPDDNQVGLAITGTSLTSSNAQSLIDLTQTWNTTGNPTALKLNITNTASGASANLMDLQVGGTSQFQVTKGGAIQTAGGVPWKLNGSVVTLGGSNLQGISVDVNGTTYYLVTGYLPEPEPDPSAAPASGPSGNYKTYNKPTPTRSVQDAKIAALEKELAELKEMIKSIKK